MGASEISYEPENADISALTITSSDDSVFSVTQDSQNKAYFNYEAEAEGTATLTATCGNVTTTHVVSVTESGGSEVTSLEIDIDAMLGLDETGTSSILYSPLNADISDLTLTSNDSSVLSVTQNASNPAEFSYVAESEGTATLEATCGNVTATRTLDVYSTIQSVDVNMEGELVVGDTGEGSIDWIPHSLDASGMTITSSDDSVVSVTIDPVNPEVFTYEALSEGTATITAECDGESTGIQVSVSAE